MAFEKLFSAGNDVNILPDVHTTRLDAEMFTADDLDGVTEGLTGSGNLNYLVLQSQQTNESFAVHDPFSIKGSDFSGSDPIGPGAFGIPGYDANGSRGSGDGAGKGAEPGDNLANMNDLDSGDPAASVPEGGNHGAVSAVSNFGASTLDTSNASDIYNRFFESEIGNDGINGLDGIGQNGGDGVPGPIGGNGNNGNNGNDGNDGVSPEPPDDPPGGNDDVDLQVDIISDIIGVDLDVVLDPIENLVGDIDIDVDAILGDLLSTDDGILPNPSIIIDGLIGGIELIDDLQLDVLLTPVENLLTDVVGALNPALGGLLPFLPDPLGLVTGILDGLNADGDTDLLVNLDLGLPDIIGLGGLGAINLDIPLDPLEMLLGDIDLGLSGESMLNDLLTGGLTVPVVDLSLLSTGDVLSGLDAIISTDDLLGGASDLIDNLASGDLLGDNGLLGDGALLDGVLGEDGILGEGLLGGDLLGDGGLLQGGALDGLNNAVESLLGDLSGGLPGGDGDPVGDLLDGVLGGDADPVGDLLGGVLGGGDGDPVGDLLGGILGGSPDDGAGADTDLTVDTGFDLGDAIIDQVDLDATLDPIENLVGDIDIGLNIQTDAVQDILNGDVEGAVDSVLDNLTNGIDLNLALLNPEDEQNSGVELNLDSVTDGVLGDGVVDDVLGDLTGGLLGNGDVDEPGADDDLSIDTGFGLGDVILDQVDLDATLDPVENLVGDIDIGINIQTDAVEDILSGDLEGALDSVVDNLANGIDIDIALLNPEPNQNGGLDASGLGGLGDLAGDLLSGGGQLGSWPEATVGGDLLGGVGDALGDVLGGGSILPEPEGLLSEGLGLINEAVGGGGNQGGLLGGLGGLFG